MKIANRLRELRKEKKLSLAGVAQAIGVPVSTYRDWEYGKAIRGEPYERIAEIFDVSLNELLSSKREGRSELLTHLSSAKNHVDIALKIARAL